MTGCLSSYYSILVFLLRRAFNQARPNTEAIMASVSYINERVPEDKYDVALTADVLV